jgi:UDP-N-acetylmuramyl pentapeptide phosphotransferase/UDP-N-acetylglucosamine-1-phosphate transferase
MGVKTRLIATVAIAYMGIYLLNVLIAKIQITVVDWVLSIGIIEIIFTAIAVTGPANTYNIIDGSNCLASIVAIISFWPLVMGTQSL